MNDELIKTTKTELGWVASTKRLDLHKWCVVGRMHPTQEAAQTAAEDWIRSHPAAHMTTADAEFYEVIQ